MAEAKYAAGEFQYYISYSEERLYKQSREQPSDWINLNKILQVFSFPTST